jgi:hypothetical protein
MKTMCAFSGISTKTTLSHQTPGYDGEEGGDTMAKRHNLNYHISYAMKGMLSSLSFLCKKNSYGTLESAINCKIFFSLMSL